VALDRQSIEKKDFPIGRRGYDPDAVDRHLTSLADELDELKSSARRRTESLAETAAEQVRAIVEAAEASGNQIRSDAEKDAREIRREARSEAKQSREEATSQAGEYVANVSAATRAMLERLDAIEQEFGALLDSLRTSASRAGSDLELLEGHLVEVRDAVAPRPVFEPEEPEPIEDQISEPIRTHEPSPAAVPESEPLPDESLYEEATPGLDEFETEAGPAEAEFADDTEGARLIALNMALNGTPREEVDRYLAENFDLSDRAGLIEEVYSSVEG
jgi:DivIVA domain-containing protein